MQIKGNIMQNSEINVGKNSSKQYLNIRLALRRKQSTSLSHRSIGYICSWKKNHMKLKEKLTYSASLVFKTETRSKLTCRYIEKF